MRNLTVIGASQIFQSSGPCSLLELYHQRPSKQYSAYNAWNLDNNGNLNNNNKYNDLTVVPLAELSEKAEVKGGLDIEKVRETVNSYLGLSRHFAAYKLRKKIAEMLFTRFHSQICFDINFNRLILK